jgi:hypothetical protein
MAETKTAIEAPPQKDVLEPFWNYVKPLRAMVDNAPDKAQPRLTNYLLVKVLDELASQRRANKR